LGHEHAPVPHREKGGQPLKLGFFANDRIGNSSTLNVSIKMSTVDRALDVCWFTTSCAVTYNFKSSSNISS
jgi:hypothetical protein